MYFGKSIAFLCVYSSSQQKLVPICCYSVYVHMCVYLFFYLCKLHGKKRFFASLYFSSIAVLRIVLIVMLFSSWISLKFMIFVIQNAFLSILH